MLVLPQPAVTSPRVDHSRTRLYAISSSGLWQLVPGDEGKPQLINRAYDDAQQIISLAAQDRELMERARAQARQVLATFYQTIGWSVQVTFED